MVEGMQFWFSKLLVELAIAAAVFVFIVLLSVPRAIRQMRCKHGPVAETQACDAICIKCGKNLGFIGTWREKQRKEV